MPSHTVLAIDDSATILKVVQLVLSKAGYSVQTALDGEEGLRLAREARPDLILLDFVMPKMNGYQVCRALAESDSTRGVPVVLMSAKGDQVGERFVKVMGIVDYINKPFSPEALSAVVAHTIEKYRSQGDGETATRAPADLSDFDADEGGTPVDLLEEMSSLAVETTNPHAVPRLVEGGDSGRLTLPVALDGTEQKSRTPDKAEKAAKVKKAAADPGVVRARALSTLREALVRAAAGDDLVGDEIAERVRLRLTDPVLERLLSGVAPGARTPSAATVNEGAEILSGDLAKVPVAEVLALLDQQRQTGILTVRRVEEDKSVDICFRAGKVEFAGAEGLGEEFLIGNFLLEREALSRQDLELFFQSRGTSSKLCGEQLVKLNYIRPEDLAAALARQTAEHIYEVLRWRSGRFSLRSVDDLGVRASHAALSLSVDEILMEGFRRIDEWHLIEREIDDFDAIFLRNEEALARLGRDQLSRDELAILELVNAKNNVRDIVRQSRMGTFEVSQMLFRLRSIRLIRRRVQPLAV